MFIFCCERDSQTPTQCSPNFFHVCPSKAFAGRPLVNVQYFTGHKVALKNHWIYPKCASASFRKLEWCDPKQHSRALYTTASSYWCWFSRASVICQQQCFYQHLGKDTINSNELPEARDGTKVQCEFHASTDGSLPGQKQPQYSALNAILPLHCLQSHSTGWACQSVAMTTSPLGQPEIALVHSGDVDLGCIGLNTEMLS